MDEQNNTQINNEPNIKTIHTYASDMADLVREEQQSVIKIALAEQKRREMNIIRTDGSISNSKNIFMIVGGIILIIASIFGIYYFTQKGKDASVVAPVQTQIKTFIAYDQNKIIDTTNMTVKSDLLKALGDEISASTNPNSIKAIFLASTASGANTLLSTNDFFSLLGVNMPGSLLRSFGPGFLFGTYKGGNKDDVTKLFLMLNSTNYDQSFAGMLTWENTMIDNLAPLFKVDTTGANQSILGMPWKDIIIENKDARVLYDASNNPVLYYMFIDKNTLVITNSDSAIKEIISRMVTANIKPL